MDKKGLEIALGAPLVQLGFRKKALTWYRLTEEILQVVNLQKSSYGLQFYVNICCAPTSMDVPGMPTPKEHKCPFRIRLTSVYPESRNTLEETLDLEKINISDKEREDAVNRMVYEMILPFMEHMKNKDSLRDAFVQGVFNRGAITPAAQEYLKK